MPEANPSRAARRIIVYERVSTDKQDMERQHVQRERAAADYSGREIEVIEDDGVSAFKVPVFDRAGGGRLCELIEAGAVEALYTDMQSRLSRGSDVEWVTFRALCETNDTRVMIDGVEQRHDLGGRMEGFLKNMLAHQESVEKSHNVRGGKRTNALKGRRNGGKRPFGFDQNDGKLTPRPDEVEGGLLIFKGWATGVTQDQIVRDLHERGITTATGKPWKQAGISQQLSNPKWIGHTRRKIDGKEVIFENTHEAVMPLELWDAAQARLKPGKTPTGRPSQYFLLSGLLYCGRCDELMKVRRDEKSYGNWEAYICPNRNCDQSAMQRRYIDPFVWSYFQSVGLDVERMVEQSRQSRDDRLADVRGRITNAQREQTKAQENIDRLLGYVAEGRQTPEEHRDAVGPQKTALEAASGALADLRAQEQAILAEPDLGDAEQETLLLLADVKAAVAGEITSKESVTAARATIGRLFSRFVLHYRPLIARAAAGEDVPEDALDAELEAEEAKYQGPGISELDAGRYYIEPVPRDEMVLAPWRFHECGDIEQEETLSRVPLQTAIGGSKASGR